MSAVCGRVPTRNLLADGYEAVAEFVARQVQRDKAAYTVHVADSGTVRLTRTNRARMMELPVSDCIGTYPYKGLRVELIEDDLLERLRELRA